MRQPVLKAPNISPEEKLAWLRLARTENVGPITFYRLLQIYGTASRALEALPAMAKRGGGKKPLHAPEKSAIETEYRKLQKMGGEIITAAEEAYPLALSAIDDAPPVISVLGNRELMNGSCIGIVGARNASLNGRKMAEKLARELGEQNQIIVSGLARGIDTSAHMGSIKTGTIAVVAGGIDIVYPEENIDLYNEIREHGLIIAESAFGQKPFAQSFPRRNRIVSGLSKGVIVIEATMKSGSLITARLAGEQGRDVYAVPGSPLDPRASGPNHLIREGATLARNAADIMQNLHDFTGSTLREAQYGTAAYEAFEEFNPDEPVENVQEILLSQLSFAPSGVDELVRTCHLTIPAVQMALLEMELAGRIQRHGGNRVSLKTED